MNHLYFIKLWRTSPLLAMVIICMCLLQGYFMYKRIHNFPFFVYDMYSRPVSEPKEVRVPVLYINGKETNYTRFPNWKEGAVVNLFKFYTACEQGPSIAGKAFVRRFGNQFPTVYQRITPSFEDVKRFPEWMAGFLEKCIHDSLSHYQMGYRLYPVTNRQINMTEYEEDIRLDWHP